MKECSMAECHNKIFSHNFCRIHQWMRKDEKYLNYKKNIKPKKRQITLKKESKKRKIEHQRYIDLIKKRWEEAVINGTNWCFFCGKKSDKILVNHHLKKRTGDYYLDEAWFTWADNECHNNYHFKSVEWLIKQPWYNDWMNRLKEKSEDLWRAERKKMEKNLEMSFD